MNSPIESGFKDGFPIAAVWLEHDVNQKEDHKKAISIVKEKLDPGRNDFKLVDNPDERILAHRSRDLVELVRKKASASEELKNFFAHGVKDLADCLSVENKT